MKKKALLLTLTFPVICILIAICAGRYAISPLEMVQILLTKIGLGGGMVPPSPEAQSVFWQIRLPRIVLAFTVGSALAVSGAVFQALFRNPLASPDLLGVTAGASFGAVLALMFFPPLSLAIKFSSFLFGVAAVLCVHVLAVKSRDQSTAVLILGGIIVSAVFQAGVSVLKYLTNTYDMLAQIVFWLMGSFQTATWDSVWSVFLVTMIGTALIVAFSWRLNIMSQDDEQALSLGVDVVKWRIIYVAITTLMVGISVSACGVVGWIGLVVPHIARSLVGSEHRRLIFTSALLGASLMLLMDTLARSLFSSEIPISIVTSLLGAPFLGYLVLHQRKEWVGK
ncbi:FecCD family ABC transporter permease [Desulfosporosinus nitroreducens]|uniref:Iron ABC transporter permease n=1 Tax=Desulfosporosinus nitroreducens TaxID=2018668 RepID=A0ABT8QWV5_9FIRM|nr:iron ABC transporter permease [Desulfosporosinus nitroreducens]MCO1602308.1 iron ABC transporter permease [Desulfosporosinus nitroreducens]MDO0825822.1 iron ABC transporter permease [Desulfosporosinus nitroreducens]